MNQNSNINTISQEYEHEQIPPPEWSFVSNASSAAKCSHCSKRLLILSAIFVVVLVVVVSVSAVCATGGCGSKNRNNASSSTSMPGTTAMVGSGGNTTNSTSTTSLELSSLRAQAIVDYMNSVTLTGVTFALPLESQDPIVKIHEQALRWLIVDDPLKLSPDTPGNQLRLRQRYALRLLFAQEDSASPWTNRTVWSSSFVEECEWYGVDCEDLELENSTDVQSGVVVGIDLRNNSLSGILPADLGLLPALTEFGYITIYFEPMDGID